MISKPIRIKHGQISATIRHLQEAGLRRSECVVLWCGDNTDDAITVRDVYVPEQIAAVDYFRIPRLSMQHLMTRLREHNWMIAAQVHSHPMEAFHSAADDRWAIVRHKGAISIVTPFFAEGVTATNFLERSACFSLGPYNKWDLISYPSSNNSVLVTT
jgi:Na+-transporting NADH:ubiquinone oxidoreductase subunit NqrA